MKVLKNMLKELGMEGKPSLAKCKEIATRRELLKDVEGKLSLLIYIYIIYNIYIYVLKN